MWLLDFLTKHSRRKKRLDLLRRFGPAHINLFAHTSCAEGLKQQIAERGEVIAQTTEAIPPKELLSRFRDITHCDVCGKLFQESDDSYVRYMAMSPDEFELWREVEREKK